MSPTRLVPCLLVLPALGVAGWFGGKWAHEGLQATPRTATRGTPQPLVAREPVVSPSSPEGKWMARAESAGPGDFAALLEEFDRTFPVTGAYEVRSAAQRWILGHWILRDADAAAAYVAGKKDASWSNHFGRALAGIAPGKAGVILNGPHGKALGEHFSSTLMRNLATNDPREYLRVFEKNNKSSSQYWAEALGALAATDPAAAAELWSGKNPQKEEKALFAVLDAWMQRDPRAAREWADGLKDAQARHLATHACVGALARQDPAAARRALAEMDPGKWVYDKNSFYGHPDESSLRDARLELAAATARSDLSAALADLAALKVKIKIDAPPEVLADPNSAEYRNDPRQMMRRAIVKAALPSLPDEPAALIAVLQNLKTGAGAALDARLFAELEAEILHSKLGNQNTAARQETVRLLGMRQGDGPGTELARGFIYTLAFQDPAGTVDFLATLPEEQRGVLAGAVFSNLSEKDPALVARLANAIPADKWTDEMGRKLASAPEAFATIVSGLPASAGTEEARREFAAAWAQTNPDAAAHWVVSLPANAGAVQAARGLAGAWARYDETAVSTWAATLPAGSTRDGAALGLAAAVAATDPEAAWKWAESIAGSDLAAAAYSDVARQWGAEAPLEFRTAFTAALEASGLTEENRAKALSELNKPRQSQLSPPP